MIQYSLATTGDETIPENHLSPVSNKKAEALLSSTVPSPSLHSLSCFGGLQNMLFVTRRLTPYERYPAFWFLHVSVLHAWLSSHPNTHP